MSTRIVCTAADATQRKASWAFLLLCLGNDTFDSTPLSEPYSYSFFSLLQFPSVSLSTEPYVRHFLALLISQIKLLLSSIICESSWNNCPHTMRECMHFLLLEMLQSHRFSVVEISS